MNILHEKHSDKGQFTASIDGKQAGLMTYKWSGADKIIIDHTEVDPAFKGQGVGQALVLASVDFARAENISIQPVCPFVVHVFDKNPDIQDVRTK